MKKIDLKTWPRHKHYDFFMTLDIPQYQMTFEIDVTPIVLYTKRIKESFYFNMMHAAVKAMMQVENFRYRIINQEVYLLDHMHPSFTDVMEGTDLFKFVTTNYHEDKDTFMSIAKEASRNQDFFIDYEKEKRADLIYVTTFPWSSYLHGTHAINVDKYDAIPRLSWGQYELRDDKYKMPFTIMVHHGFIDGYHVHLYLEKLNENIEKYVKM